MEILLVFNRWVIKMIPSLIVLFSHLSAPQSQFSTQKSEQLLSTIVSMSQRVTLLLKLSKPSLRTPNVLSKAPRVIHNLPTHHSPEAVLHFSPFFPCCSHCGFCSPSMPDTLLLHRLSPWSFLKSNLLKASKY